MTDPTRPPAPESPAQPPVPGKAPSAPSSEPGVSREGSVAASEPPAPESPKPAAPKPPPRPSAEAAGAKPEAKKPEPKAAAPPTGPLDPPPPGDRELPPFIRALQAKLPGVVEQVAYWVGDWTVVVPADQLLTVMRFLRDDPEAAFDYCSDVTATDWPPRPKRFDVIYCLYSTRSRHRLRVKVRAGEGDPVPSVTGIWPAANWLEREVYDMFGVNLTGHPDRRRILMPEEWQGFPERKDYPLEGPGELLMENPLDWLRLRNVRDEADIE